MSFDEIEGVEHQKLGDKPISREEENILLEDKEVDQPETSKKRHRNVVSCRNHLKKNPSETKSTGMDDRYSWRA